MEGEFLLVQKSTEIRFTSHVVEYKLFFSFSLISFSLSIFFLCFTSYIVKFGLFSVFFPLPTLFISSFLSFFLIIFISHIVKFELSFPFSLLSSISMSLFFYKKKGKRRLNGYVYFKS